MANLWGLLLDIYSPIGALAADFRSKGAVDRVGFVVGVVLPIACAVLAAVRQARTTKGRLDPGQPLPRGLARQGVRGRLPGRTRQVRQCDLRPLRRHAGAARRAQAYQADVRRA
jgi:hypothetical protein